MPSHRTSIDIAADPATVWAVTCDVASWPAWSPTMDAVRRQDSGPIRAGSTAHVEQPKLRAATWVVDEAEPDRTFIWHTAGPGYRITATHLLTARDGGTTVQLDATISGPLAVPLWLLAGRTTRRYLDEEAAALKVRCEAGD